MVWKLLWWNDWEHLTNGFDLAWLQILGDLGWQQTGGVHDLLLSSISWKIEKISQDKLLPILGVPEQIFGNWHLLRIFLAQSLYGNAAHMELKAV